MALYQVQNRWGGSSAPWHEGGIWVIGGRSNQDVISINVTSSDNGQTLTGIMTYIGEGQIGFQAQKIGNDLGSELIKLQTRVRELEKELANQKQELANQKQEYNTLLNKLNDSVAQDSASKQLIEQYKKETAILNERTKLYDLISDISQDALLIQTEVKKVQELATQANNSAAKTESLEPGTQMAILAREYANKAQIAANSAAMQEKLVEELAPNVTAKLETEISKLDGLNTAKDSQEKINKAIKEAEQNLEQMQKEGGNLTKINNAAKEVSQAINEAEKAVQMTLQQEQLSDTQFDNWGTVSNLFGMETIPLEIEETVDENTEYVFAEINNWALVEEAFGLLTIAHKEYPNEEINQ